MDRLNRLLIILGIKNEIIKVLMGIFVIAVFEEQCLNQIHIDEQFGAIETKKDKEEEKKR